MANQYTLGADFTAITEESGTIQNIGHDAVELVSTTNATAGEGILLMPGEIRSFNGTIKARSMQGENNINVVDFKEQAGGGGGSYVLPVATASKLGGVKVGSGLSIDESGVLSSSGGGSYVLPTASASTLGGVKIGDNVTIDGNGAISVTGTDVKAALGTGSGTAKYLREDGAWETPPDTQYSDATTSAAGLMSAADKTKLDGLQNYTLPEADASTLGGVKVGTRLSIDSNGVLSADDQSYTLPTAAAATLGGVKIGDNVTIDGNGAISVTGTDVKAALGTGSGTAKYLREDGTWETPPDTQYSDATTSAAGLMSAADKTKLDGLQNYTLPEADASTLGGVKVGTRLSIDSNGVLSADDQSYSLPTASASTLGGVKVGSGLSIDGNGVLSSSGGGGFDFQPHIYVTTLKTGCTVTCTRNGVSATYTVDSETGVIDFAIPSFGEWSVTCAKDGHSRTDVVNINEIKIYYLTITNGYLYGYRIKKTESDPATRVEYLYDAVGMTPAHMDFTNSEFDYGDWGDLWFVKNNKPCMLKSDGTVDYYLDPDDYTKKADGTASDVANASYDGNAMSEIPLVWVKRWEDETYEYEVVCDFQYDNDYKAYAHTKEDGTIADKFYFSMFGGSGSAAKIRSLSGQSLSQSLTTANQIAGATANGSGWYIHSWSQRELLRTLCVLIGRSTDTQSVFGSGNCRSASSASGMLTTGTLNDKGQFFGYNNSTNQVKVFHVEKLWGDQWDRVAGLINNSGNIYVKMTPEGDGYRVTDVTGYTNTGITLSGTSGGYISQCQCGDFGIIPKVISGSGTTYYADGAWFNNGQLDYLIAGASAGLASALGGAFSFYVAYAPAAVTWSIGCGLSYL